MFTASWGRAKGGRMYFFMGGGGGAKTKRHYNVSKGTQGAHVDNHHQCINLSYEVVCRKDLKPRPEAHMDMILFEVFLKSIDLIPQQQILQQHYLYYR